MRLIDHLKATGEKIEVFAERIGEPNSTIRKIVYGQRQPSLPLAVKIETATGGAVTGSDMLLPTAGETAPSCGNADQLSTDEVEHSTGLASEMARDAADRVRLADAGVAA